MRDLLPTPIRYEQIQRLFLGAIELPAQEREDFVKRECSDGQIVAEVIAMLRSEEQLGLLDIDMPELTSRVFGLPETSLSLAGAFGEYQIIRHLGEGGTGVVYLATRRNIGGFAAIKVLRDAWISEGRRERFISEQRTLAQLDDPAIARIFDANTLKDGTPWFAMEYVDGIALTDFCSANKVSIEGRLRLFRSVCEAVQFAHGRAVVHRDLKPSNILVTAAGRVKLLDFGIAKHLDDAENSAMVTRTGQRFMTPGYAAPEQITGGQPGIYTDIYALGVILYELLTGVLPHDLGSCSVVQAERKVLEEEPEKPSIAAAKHARKGKAAWSDLDVLCLTAMRQDPSRRYGTVEAFIRDVDHYLSGQPLQARPESWRYRLAKFAARNRTYVLAALFVAVLFAVTVAYFTLRLTASYKTARTAEARALRIQQFMLSLFEAGDKEVGPSADLRITTVIDRGVKEAKALQSEPDVQAELYMTLGGIYQKFGNLNRAEELLNASLERRKSLYGSKHKDVGESMVALGLLRIDQARLNEAEALIRQGMTLIVQSRPKDDTAVAKAMTALGSVLTAKGSYTQAVPVLEQAVDLLSRRDSSRLDLAAALESLSDVQFYAGHYDLCEKLSARAVKIHRMLLDKNHPLIAEDLINLGAVQFERGRYAEAEKIYRQALEIHQHWYGENNPTTASTVSMIARALVFEGDYDRGAKLAKRALAIQERVFGPNSPRVANVLNELGVVALRSELFAEAHQDFSRVERIYKAAYGENHYLYAIALANQASVYLAEKKYALAEQMFREAIQRYAATLSPTDMRIAIAQVKLGRTLLREKRFAEAETYSLTGYNTLIRQTSPTVSWIQTARQDLTEIYEATGKPQNALKFKSDLRKSSSSAQK